MKLSWVHKILNQCKVGPLSTVGGYRLPQLFPGCRLAIIPLMTNSQLDIRKYDWFELFRDGLDDDDRKELDAFAVRVNEHRAAIAVAG